MKKPKKILVYVDCHSPVPQVALQWAAALAKSGKASILLVDVLDDFPWFVESRAITRDDVYRAIITQKEARLEEHAQKLRAKGLKVRTQVLRGKPFEEITREVLRRSYDMVVRTVMGEGTLGGTSMGNTGIRLVRKCPCPVLLARPRRGGHRLRRVVCALDPAPSDEQRNAFSSKLFETAAYFARTGDIELTVVHAWLTELESLLTGEVIAGDIGRYTSGLRAEVGGFLEEFLARYRKRAPDFALRLLKGDPRDAIPRYLSRAKADLLVMGTVSQVGIPRLVVGSTTESLLRRVPCSVLVVKPDGFESPVTL